MLSAEDIATVKVAIETCNNPELKREVLCAPGSDYDIKKGHCKYGNKKHWDETIKNKAAIILRNLGLPEILRKKLMPFITFVGMRMLTWAEYHEGILGLSRKYSIDFFRGSFFTSQGIIDNRKAAEELMNDKDLSIKQKFKLACLYCFTKHIPSLYKQMTKEDKEEFYDDETPCRIRQPGLVKFWSYYLMDEINKLGYNGINLDLYKLQQAIESGSQVAVEYCFEKTDLGRKNYALVDAAIEAVARNTVPRKDWIVFRGQRYDYIMEKWIPSDYCVGILYFLLSKMLEDEQIDFLKTRIGILHCFLDWPYQDFFMKTAKLMMGYLTKRDYAEILLKISDSIEAPDGTLKNTEVNSYGYRRLLNEFWCQSSEHYKRYFFSKDVFYCSDRFFKSAGAGLLFKLSTLKNFTYEDKKNINLIWTSATGKEKENIYSKDWTDICVKLIREGKWDVVNRFVLNFFSSKEDANKFKRMFCFTKEAQHLCIDFIKITKLNVAESFIKWSSLPEQEINRLKIEMIYSESGMRACIDLIYIGENIKYINKFIEWFLPSEEVQKFRKKFIFSNIGVEFCSELVINDSIEFAHEFTKWCLSSEEDIKELKKKLAYIKGYFVCEKLISDNLVEYIYDDIGYFTNRCMIKFKGGMWEQVEKFLTWCFTSEKEIIDFKKNVFHGKQCLTIHFNLIKANQWGEAETFFAWLGLSAEEIKELKKEILLNHGTNAIFRELLYSKESEDRCIDYGSKQEAIELFLRWYLPDKETVLKFKNEYKSKFPEKVTEYPKAIFDNFDLMIEQRLNDLDEEQGE